MNTGVGCHFLFREIFQTQGSNLSLLHLLHRQADSLLLVSLGKPKYILGFTYLYFWFLQMALDYRSQLVFLLIFHLHYICWNHLCYFQMLPSLPWYSSTTFYLSIAYKFHHHKQSCNNHICSCSCVYLFDFVVIQSISRIWLFVTPWTTACQASLSFTISWSLFKFMSIKSMMLFNHFVLCRPLLLLPSIFPSIRVFSNELALHIRWPKYWSFSFSISLSNEYSRLISFRIEWFDLLAVQGILKSPFQHHSSKASILVW